MSLGRRPSALLTVAGLGGSLLSIVIGAAVTARLTTATVAFGSLLVVFGLSGILGWCARYLAWRAVSRPAVARGDARLLARPAVVDGEESVLHPRRAGAPTVLAHTALVLMGAWALVMIVLALLRGAPGWLVLLVPWAVLVLAGPVLAAAGRLSPGGVHVTATRIVDVDRGARAEVALVDVGHVARMPDALVLDVRPGAVRTQRTAGPWSRRPPSSPLVIETLGTADGGAALAAQLAAATRRV
ncbi:hypothetical protein [Litorihabitans aurantiacus]|uniref:PH domain-containing protein n=1 Tax=Litorihabitans aurantiacus TaxID=1930061 RepID=A0AA38CR14_9MICO|nr:hypothetical protein [Litorihabitans aurantiacus]GMA32693.1 hypothetical protein GCM10025875_26850 [Litorihabitans aurantiacus]